MLIKYGSTPSRISRRGLCFDIRCQSTFPYFHNTILFNFRHPTEAKIISDIHHLPEIHTMSSARLLNLYDCLGLRRPLTAGMD